MQAVCELLTVAGKTLDSSSPQSKNRTTAYFTVMEKWMNSKSLSSRTRFMARDLIELRRSSWIPRRAQLQVLLLTDNMLSSCFCCKFRRSCSTARLDKPASQAQHDSFDLQFSRRNDLCPLGKETCSFMTIAMAILSMIAQQGCTLYASISLYPLRIYHCLKNSTSSVFWS